MHWGSRNMTLKNKAFLGGWISMAAKVFRREKNMTGIKIATWKNKQYTITKIFTSWKKLFQSSWIIELTWLILY